MSSIEEASLSHERLQRHRRIRRLKKWLRYLPRKATAHKHPVLKYFASTIRKRAYLWSFRTSEAVPALYAGWVLTMLPVMSCQIFLACIAAIIFRANVVILVALQFVSTPFTVPFLWYLDYKVGRFFLELFKVDTWNIIQEACHYAGNYIHHFGKVGCVGKKVFRWFITTSIGGTILGLICGIISSILYRRACQHFQQHRKRQSLAIHPEVDPE
ncbi:MAG: DUF2062 domain-containing protein [Puniceicoccales bacterium]|jgi:uncharacterized protein (DUF2062 family)|nr:DUF2062 domain-containing protein [Puniceicoccales bacterium]